MVKIVGLLRRVCQWFDAIEVHDPKIAQLLVVTPHNCVKCESFK